VAKKLLNQDDYDRAFNQLFGDNKKAEDYLRLWRSLVTFFRVNPWGGGVLSEEELATEVLDRVVHKVAAGVEIENVTAYALGVAQFVRLEELKRRSKFLPLSTVAASWVQQFYDEDSFEVEDICREHCLAALHSKDRETLTRYSLSDKPGKEKLAAELGISQKTLRVKVHRLRQNLRSMVESIRKELDA
jgi:DNA-directed RNA polymerase specialized sigma24 family protein